MTTPPRFPQWKDLTAVNFVTEAFLVGCTPNIGLFLEFAKEPAQDLLLFFLLPDAFDIGQAIFEPKRGRRTKPARHGRKRRRGAGIPDVNDLIGGKVRAVANPYNAIRLTPFRYLFPILNIYEGINFGVAVIEGLTDVVYSGMLGALLMRPNNCRELGRYYAYMPSESTESFNTTVAVSPTVLNVNFDNSLWTCRYPLSDYYIGFQCEIMPSAPGDVLDVQPVLKNLDGEIIHSGGVSTIRHGTWTTITVGGDFPEDEWCEWGVSGTGGFLKMREKMVLAFGS